MTEQDYEARSKATYIVTCERLRKIRLDMGMTVEDLGRHMGYVTIKEVTTVRMWERGLVTPSFVNLCDWIAALGAELNVWRPAPVDASLIGRKAFERIEEIDKLDPNYDSQQAIREMDHQLAWLNSITFEERAMIDAALNSADDLIRLEEERLALLKQHRVGLEQQLLPRLGDALPRVRFPQFGPKLSDVKEESDE
jgi:transcriptional regulator with XRE-family HTH domain